LLAFLLPHKLQPPMLSALVSTISYSLILLRDLPFNVMICTPAHNAVTNTTLRRALSSFLLDPAEAILLGKTYQKKTNRSSIKSDKPDLKFT
jgi:hypothetical protein